MNTEVKCCGRCYSFFVPFQFPLFLGYLQYPAPCVELPGTAHLSQKNMHQIPSPPQAYWASQIFFLGINNLFCVCLLPYLLHFNGRK